MGQALPTNQLVQGSEVSSTSGRTGERSSAVAQMMEENSDGIGMQVIVIMVQRYAVLPRELWDLNRISDMGAGRGVIYKDALPEATFERIIGNDRYSIVKLTISRDVSREVKLPNNLLHLTIMANAYTYPLNLPWTLQELIFDPDCKYNLPLVLPLNLRKLVLCRCHNQPCTFPPGLLELKLGSAYSQHLILPPQLKRLAFDWRSPFNLPVALPPNLVSLLFGEAYNQVTTLPCGLEELKIGWAFTHELSLPNTLRKLMWCCNRSVQVPDGVVEAEFHGVFNQSVILPASLRKATFYASTHPHPLILPSGCKELYWCPKDYEGLVLPAGLRKLTWMSARYVELPLGLRELVLGREAPVVLPNGLLKITFDHLSHQSHYDLPESVREVHLLGDSTFTHPSTLQHLIVEYSYSEKRSSRNTIHKITMNHCTARINKWPQGLKELAFTVDDIIYPVHVPYGCTIVGEKRPENVIMGDDLQIRGIGARAGLRDTSKCVGTRRTINKG